MVARLLVVALLVGLGAGITACFTLGFANGSIACSDDPTRRCPAGYTCINDRCWTRNTVFDGGSD